MTPKSIWVAFTLAASLAIPAHASDHTIPAADLQDDLPDDVAFDRCLNDAISDGGTCTLPYGVLTLTTYPSALRRHTNDGDQIMVHLNNATLRGQGVNTTIRGVGPSAFDVLNLNAVSNFNIENLSITTTVDVRGGSSGINGISMTNGTNHINIRNVHVYDLPYVQHYSPTYIDGGKAFTVQTGKANTNVSMRAIRVENSSSRNVLIGFSMDADTNINVEPDDINVIGNSFEGHLAGISFGFVAPTSPMTRFGAAIISNAAKGGKYGIALGRGRAYYVKSNYVVLRDDLSRSFDSGDFEPNRMAFSLFEVPNATIELNTFELQQGDFFVKAKDADSKTILWRQNNFYGNPSRRIETVNCSATFAADFEAAGVFH